MRGTQASRMVLNCVRPSWIGGRPPPPQYVKGRFSSIDNSRLIYQKRDENLGKGLVFSAPSQDPSVLVQEYGAFISPSFVREQEGKKPRWCNNYSRLGDYEQRRSMKMETLKQMPSWAVPGMHMWEEDMEGAFNHLRFHDDDLRHFVLDCGPHPDGLPPSDSNPRFLLVQCSGHAIRLD